MQRHKTKVNFHDHRGDIRDILIGEEVDAITFITCNKGAVRGNHFHKKTWQFDYVLKGSFAVYTRVGLTGRIKKTIVRVGDQTAHPPGERHALEALEYSELLTMTRGPRKGNAYEKDTIRLDPSLVKSKSV